MIHFNSRSEKKYYTTKYLKCPEAWLQKSKKVYKGKKEKKNYSFLNFLWPNLKWTESARKNIEVPKQTTIIRIPSEYYPDLRIWIILKLKTEILWLTYLLDQKDIQNWTIHGLIVWTFLSFGKNLRSSDDRYLIVL